MTNDSAADTATPAPPDPLDIEAIAAATLQLTQGDAMATACGQFAAMVVAAEVSGSIDAETADDLRTISDGMKAIQGITVILTQVARKIVARVAEQKRLTPSPR